MKAETRNAIAVTNLLDLAESKRGDPIYIDGIFGEFSSMDLEHRKVSLVTKGMYFMDFSPGEDFGIGGRNIIEYSFQIGDGGKIIYNPIKKIVGRTVEAEL